MRVDINIRETSLSDILKVLWLRISLMTLEDSSLTPHCAPLKCDLTRTILYSSPHIQSTELYIKEKMPAAKLFKPCELMDVCILQLKY